ncbi:Uncharacterised protein [Clostridioides difficile]|nr:Uncharacterised protein [Clostridioides difficile]
MILKVSDLKSLAFKKLHNTGENLSRRSINIDQRVCKIYVKNNVKKLKLKMVKNELVGIIKISDNTDNRRHER